MRFFALSISVFLFCLVLSSANNVAAQDLQLDDRLAPPLSGQLTEPEMQAPPADDIPFGDENSRTEREQQLDALFGKLKKTRSQQAAGRLAAGIWSQWFKSGSASIDLLMEWSNEASQRQDYNIALDLLDQVITRKPDYAEGWNRRATLHFIMFNYRKSMHDIQKVLELEPRHFGALSGMAVILERTDNKQAALDAWRRVLEIYPAMRSGQDAVIRLSDALAGDPT